MNLVQETIGVDLATLKDLGKNLKIGQAEIRLLMNLYKNHNLMQYITHNFLNGSLLINLKMLLMLPEEVLVKFIGPFGMKDTYHFGSIKNKNG